jgi:F0F1-type ATP synthase membrane subunit c/vacuolar-type H+-ATPase subunit K
MTSQVVVALGALGSLWGIGIVVSTAVEHATDHHDEFNQIDKRMIGRVRE